MLLGLAAPLGWCTLLLEHKKAVQHLPVLAAGIERIFRWGFTAELFPYCAARRWNSLNATDCPLDFQGAISRSKLTTLCKWCTFCLHLWWWEAIVNVVCCKEIGSRGRAMPERGGRMTMNRGKQLRSFWWLCTGSSLWSPRIQGLPDHES